MEKYKILAYNMLINELESQSIFKIMSEDGTSARDASEIGLSHEQLRGIYRAMLTARLLDEWLMRIQRVGKIPFHAPNIGHEAIAAIAYALKEHDWIFPSHRDLALQIARGVTLEELVAHYMVNAKSSFKGRDILTIGNKKLRIFLPPIPISTNIPPAVGFAMACKLRKRDEVAAVFFGDGATSKGDFHEAMNFAGVFKAPIVFFCENNQYAISCPVVKQTASESLAIKATAYGFPGIRVDGNDPLAVYLAAREAVDRARSGEGPTLVELFMYRLGPHSTADDAMRYRTIEEVRMWEEREPVKRFKCFLVKSGIMSEEDDRKMREEIEAAIRRAIEINEEQPPHPPESIMDDVYAERLWHIEEERENLSSELSNKA